MNIALILSGGVGSRLGTDIPKQYVEVAGKRIIDYCLDTFEMCVNVDAIHVVADEQWMNLTQMGGRKKVKGYSKPGETRQLSILSGLEDMVSYASEEDIVIIHDAARPLVSEKMIEDLLAGAREHDGAIPVLPMKDTVYFSEDGRQISSLLERRCIYAGQAPESFKFGKYLVANRALLPTAIYKINGSTEAAILAGMDIAMILGDEKNFKITTKEDLERFKELVE